MKSAMPYAGLTAPVLRSACKEVFAAHPIDSRDAWLATAGHLWRKATVREERYAAIELLGVARYRRAWLDPSAVPLLREMIVSGAWWDFVDSLAANELGYLLEHYEPAIRPVVEAWLGDPDLWLRRSAILVQLKFKTRTNTALLAAAIEGSIDDRAFFARKAIGWALREYSKTDPQWVAGYVAEHVDRLSPLSQREALKLIAKRTAAPGSRPRADSSR